MLMNDDNLLIRRLHGELDDTAARVLDARLEREPELRARLRELRDVWEAPPGPLPAFDGVRDSVLERVRRARGGELSWSAAPAWARAGTAAALVLGVTLGFSLGAAVRTVETVETVPATGVDDALLSDGDLDAFAVPSLADNYWQAVEDEDGETS
jgi:anti-sigma factor RsiW